MVNEQKPIPGTKVRHINPSINMATGEAVPPGEVGTLHLNPAKVGMIVRFEDGTWTDYPQNGEGFEVMAEDILDDLIQLAFACMFSGSRIERGETFDFNAAMKVIQSAMKEISDLREITKDCYER